LRIILLSFLLQLYAGHEAAGQAKNRLLREGNRFTRRSFLMNRSFVQEGPGKGHESPQQGSTWAIPFTSRKDTMRPQVISVNLPMTLMIPLTGHEYHNLGNSLLMSQQVRQSIEAYKEALRNNPGDEETRHNLAFARKLLDEMENQDQDDRGDDGDQNEQGDDRQPDDPRGNDPEEGGDNDQEGDPDQDNTPDESSRQQPDQLLPEDVLRMLEAAEREEKQVQEKLMENRARERRPATGNNW
jgi:hypothetical protein